MECRSRIVEATIYARGAWVTRKVEVPADAPAGRLRLEIDGLTPRLAGSSWQGRLTGTRRILSLRSRVEVPEAPIQESPMRRELLQLEQAQVTLEARLDELLSRRSLLSDLPLEPRLARGSAASGVSSALSALERRAVWLTRVEQEIGELEAELRELVRRRAGLLFETEQAGETVGPGQLRSRLIIETDGSGPFGELTVAYRVLDASWRPRYRLDLDGADFRLGRGALVRQNSGEDWRAVALTLCSADLVRDRNLPRLDAFRLGRVQPPARPRGLRPPPPDLDRLFSRYDLFRGQAEDTPPPPPPAPPPPPPPPKSAPASVMARMRAPQDHTIAELMAYAPAQSDGLAGAGPDPAPAELSLESWLDYDLVRLAGPEEKERGRLVMEYGPAFQPPPCGLERDLSLPVSGLVDVPSDDIDYRVALDTAEGELSLSWGSVPRAQPEVFREALLREPFGSGLLPGEVEVYEDGNLLLLSSLNGTGPGGECRIGLGVDERVRVARNLRWEEDKGGLLGDQRAVLHRVTLEVSNLLSADIRVTVCDWLPVSDEKALKVKLLSCQPTAQDYDAGERGHPRRGGLRWQLEVGAGARARVEYAYQIQFPQRNELVGGNRRD